MNKQLQDRVWLALPEAYRREVKEMYEKHVRRQTITSQDTLLDMLFGQHNLESEEEPEEGVSIEGWVARDENGALYLFHDKPTRADVLTNERGYWVGKNIFCRLEDEYFPQITWESEPQKVVVNIDMLEGGAD